MMKKFEECFPGREELFGIDELYSVFDLLGRYHHVADYFLYNLDVAVFCWWQGTGKYGEFGLLLR